MMQEKAIKAIQREYPSTERTLRSSGGRVEESVSGGACGAARLQCDRSRLGSFCSASCRAVICPLVEKQLASYRVVFSFRERGILCGGHVGPTSCVQVLFRCETAYLRLNLCEKQLICSFPFEWKTTLSS